MTYSVHEPLHCCAIKGIAGFLDDQEMDDRDVAETTRDIIGHERVAMDNNQSIILISLNTYQKKTKKLLKKLGYKSTPWADRPRPRDTKVCLLYKFIGGK